MCLQDHEASNYNKLCILGHCNKNVAVNIPGVLHRALKKKSGSPPRYLLDFKPTDFVPTAAKCKCVLLRQKKSLGRDNCKPDENGMYPCSVCERQGGRNSQEVNMLNQIKHVVDARKEKIIVCCQVPVRGQAGNYRQRCDVLLVPCAAQDVNQLVVIELDSTDHFEKPRQYGQSPTKAFNRAVVNDGNKNKAVYKAGMRLLRLAWQDMDSGSWETELNGVLDALQLDAM